MSEKNRTGLDWEFVAYVRDQLRHGKTIAEILPTQGPIVIERLLDLPTWETSLRQLAKDTKVSATYLSRIHRGQLVISKALFVALSDLLQKRTGIIGLTEQGRRKRRGM